MVPAASGGATLHQLRHSALTHDAEDGTCTPGAQPTCAPLMHGPDHHHLYVGSYPDADLRWWADRIREWDLAGHELFVYFNNDGDANAVRNADPPGAARVRRCQPSGFVRGQPGLAFRASFRDRGA